jgi:hypothetical protein
MTAPRDCLKISLSGVTPQEDGETPVADLAAAEKEVR